jgi:hypothetical protein
MASWILSRPSERANVAELRVAEILAGLPDDWLIRWGFYYEDNAGTTREGDFLILGPRGGVMMLEVKAGSLDYTPSNGRWETENHDNPLYQLDAEWKAVVRVVNDHRGTRPSLYVVKALAVPQLELDRNLATYHGIPRQFILCGSELRDFTAAWDQRFKDPRIIQDSRSREIFLETFGKDGAPKAIRHFVDLSDRALLRQTEANYELLDQLAENRQLMVKGGPGSGKTWLAFEQACRWADETKNGLSVLFLCYNLALTHFLKEMAANAQRRGRIKRGSITVMSWQELACLLLTKAGLPYEVPDADAAKSEFFSSVLPGLMAQVVAEGLIVPEYDALVVDEAQDHDTSASGFPTEWEGPGWWGIYWKLLREGSCARTALFYDPAQRPSFRVGGGFDANELHRTLSANPVKVQLHRSVRYTRSILGFLKSLRTPALACLLDTLQQKGSLPEGPDVEFVSASRSETAQAVSTIVKRWLSSGLCRPDEVLILSLHGHTGKSSLDGCAELAGCPVVDFLDRRRDCISRTSVNRAKGLDALGVILVDFPEFKQITQDSTQTSYFMGASRARQLLAVVHVVPGVKAPRLET